MCVLLSYFPFQDNSQPEFQPRQVHIMGRGILSQSSECYHVGTSVLVVHDPLFYVRLVQYSVFTFGLQDLIQILFCSYHRTIFSLFRSYNIVYSHMPDSFPHYGDLILFPRLYWDFIIFLKPALAISLYISS